MPVLFDDALSQYIGKETTKIGDRGLSVSVWFNADDITSQTSSMVSIADAASNTKYLTIRLKDDTVQAESSDGGPGEVTTTSTTFGANEWHNAIATIRTTQLVYLDGGGSNSGSGQIPSGLTRTNIGRLGILSAGEYMSGMLACAALWDDYRLTDAEIALLAGGAHPLTIQPSKLTTFLPLYTTDAFDVTLNGPKMTAFNGPAVGHPGPPLGCPPLDEVLYRERGIDRKIATRTI